MAGQNGKLLLCGFVIILGLLQDSAAYQCSSEALNIIALVISDPCPPSMYYSSSNSSWNASASSNLPFQDSCPIPFHGGLASMYVLGDLAPLIIYFPLLILFNVNLASGLTQSFIFFYQALPAVILTDRDSYSARGYYLITGGFLWGLSTMQNPINDLFFHRILPYITLQYCKLVVVLVATVMTVVLVKCIDCPCASWRHPWARLRRSVRHFREKRACKGTVLNGLCSIAILTYAFVIQQSFSVLQGTKNCPNGEKCAFYCTELNYKESGYYPYVIVAVGTLVLVLPLPLLLLYYPCVPALMQRVTKRSPQFMTCHKLTPVLDVFQSGYKPKLRFFAAFPLLYRFVIWLFLTALSANLIVSDRLIVVTLIFIVILAIHSLVQPYSNPKHNYIETLYLVNLVLISMMVLIVQIAFERSPVIVAGESRLVLVLASFSLALIYLPLVVCVGYFIWRSNCSKRCRAAYCKRVRRNRRESAQSEAVQVQYSEVYFAMSEAGDR